MARVVVSKRADRDLDDIFATIHRSAGYAAAVDFNAALDDLYRQLTAFPDSGPRRQGLGRDIRIGIIAPYLVIYRHEVSRDTVTVLRVIHGHRRITSRLLRSAP